MNQALSLKEQESEQELVQENKLKLELELELEQEIKLKLEQEQAHQDRERLFSLAFYGDGTKEHLEEFIQKGLLNVPLVTQSDEYDQLSDSRKFKKLLNPLSVLEIAILRRNYKFVRLLLKKGCTISKKAIEIAKSFCNKTKNGTFKNKVYNAMVQDLVYTDINIYCDRYQQESMKASRKRWSSFPEDQQRSQMFQDYLSCEDKIRALRINFDYYKCGGYEEEFQNLADKLYESKQKIIKT